MANVGFTGVPPPQLAPSMVYDAPGAWSTTGEGTADGGSVARNNEPTFPEGASATRAVDENTAADVAFGDPVAATDDDSGDTLSYSLAGTDAASFAIVEWSGQLKTKSPLNHEAKASYSVEVRADDGFVVASIAVTINVNDVNESPFFPDGAPSLDVNENTEANLAFGDPVTATDPDSGATLTYSLSGADAASFAIVESSGQLKTKGPLNYEGPQNVYEVVVTASDGSLTDSTDVSIAVNDVDEPPGTPDAPVVEPDDEDEQTSLDVTWTEPSNTGPSITDYDVQYREAGSEDDFTDASYDGVGVSATITDLSPNTTYEVQVRATNDEGTGSWSMSGEGATGAGPNNEPTFPEGASTTRAVDENTGADVAFGDPVTATDDDGSDTLSYSLSGKDAASFAIVEWSGQLKTKAPLDYETKATYSVEVRADDGFVVKSIAVTIDVNDVNESPFFPEGALSLDVNENAEADVAFGDPVTATDPDNGATLTYSLSGADAASFGIVESSGQLKTKGPLNYEGPQNVYDVIVTADDGSLTDSVEVSIAVNDLDEPPGTPDAPTVDAAATDGHTSLDVTWTAPSNTGPSITDYDVQYRVVGSEDDFADASYDGLAVSATITDLSPNTTYEVQVRATNDEGMGPWSMSGEGATGAGPNNEPTFPEGASTTRTVNENTATDVAFGDPVTATDDDGSDTLSYSLSGKDAASFAIVESSGQLETKAPLDYETKSSYSVTVTVRDGTGGMASIAVTVNVNDVNESPFFPEGAPSLDVHENTEADVAFGDPVTATDPDSGAALTYSLSGADAASFTIVESSGQLKAKNPLDYETQNVYEVTVTASDGSLTDSTDVSIAVNDLDEPPGTPDAPTVDAAATDGHMSLGIAWTAPSNTGPAITDYDVQYREAGSEADFADASHDGVAIQATIVELGPNTTYEVQVRATNDEGMGSWSMSGEGTTDSVNTPPTFPEGASATRAVDENTAADVAFGDRVTATDDDSGDTLSYSLAGTDAASFAIVEWSGQLKTKAPLDYETKATYSVEVRADDGFVVASIAVTINVNDVNESPFFPDGAPSLDVNENTEANLAFGDPVTATDPDSGAALTYSLSGADAASFGIVESSGQLKTKGPLNYEGPQNVYEVVLTASDGSLTDSADVSIAVNDVDEPPGTPDAPTVDAAATDGHMSLGITWTAPSNTGPAITDYDVQYREAGSEDDFTDASYDGVGVSATITDLSPNTTYEVQVRATNDEGTGSWSMSGEGTTDSVNTPPTFPEGDSTTRTVNENTGADVAFGGPVTATDDDSGDTLSYSLAGADAPSFAIVESSGQLKTKASLDYETKSSYSVEVRADDGFVVKSIAVTIAVNDVNEPPVFPEGAPSLDVNENTEADVAFGNPVTATDPDSGAALTYSLSGADAASFAIVESSGQLKTKGPLNYEGPQNVYDVIVTADDGSLTASVEVSIAVNDVDEPPGTPDAPTVEAAATDGHMSLDVTWTEPSNTGPSITDYDVQYREAGSEDDFTDASFSGIATQTAITELSPGVTYEVQVRATNDEGMGSWSMSGEGATDSVNTPPTFPEGDSTTRAVDENTAADVAFGDPVAATDDDSGDTLSYSLAGADAPSFAIVESSGQLKTKASLDYEAKASYSVEVRADDGFVVASIAVTVNVNDVNEAPVFPDGDTANRAVDENTGADVAFGDLVTATDDDSGDTLSYSLSGTDAASFGIVESSGQLKTKASLDYETKSSYSVEVRADDGFVVKSIAVTIAVNDVNEPPVFPEGAPSLDVNENAEADVAFGDPVTATDPDSGAALTYSLSGADAASFAIVESSGQLKTKGPLNYEGPQNVYDVIVTADDGSLTASVEVSIAVNDVDEPPGTPDAPTVEAAATDGHMSLDVTWTEPSNTGPSITDYDVQYREAGSEDDFTDASFSGIATQTAITELSPGVTYKVQVRATNDEGMGSWSMSGEGATDSVNTPPTFPEGDSTTRAVDENTAADVAFGDPVAATDDDSGDTLSYSLAGADAPSFAIVESSGQLETKAPLDYEAKSSYLVEVRADDGFVVASIAVTIDVNDVNEAPVFPDGAPSLDVDENTEVGFAFGDPVTATDPDNGAALTYSLSGADAASFGIVESSGQLKTKGSLNYEGSQNVYEVIVTADDGSLTDSVEVSIAVNDVDEPPGAPDAPTVEAAATEGHTSLDVTWTAPSNTGPSITDYDVQYREAGSEDDFADASYDGLTVSATITDFSPNTTYEVQVRATNDEGMGSWSMSGEGTTGSANTAPTFPEGASTTRTVNENTATDVAFGDPVAATDDDNGDTLSYSLAGTDAASFAIVESSGQLETKAPLDYETKSSYSVTVTVRDGSGGMASIAVTVNVNDVDEPPGAPDAPTVEAAATDGHAALDVTWAAPSNTGPSITDYDVQYREAGSEDDFADASYDGLGVSATITDLSPNMTYEVQVRATNDEGMGLWSMSGEGTTSAAPNNAPVFTEGATANRAVDENTGADVAFGDPVTATDDDSSDMLSYSLAGTDASSFGIVESSGQLETKAPLDYETKSRYSVTVTVRDGSGGMASIAVTVNVNDLDEPPGTPDAPTVDAAATDGHAALDVTWTAPSNTGPAIKDYDVQYRVVGTEDDFTDASHDGVAIQTTIVELSPNTTYEVQVRAKNNEGIGLWSTSGEGITSSAPNSPPVFTEGAAAVRTVGENTETGQPIGNPVAATDTDGGDTLRYSLSGADAASFDIVEWSGQLRTKAPLNYEAKDEYSVTVSVDDGFVTPDTTPSIDVKIDVNEVNEPPAFLEGSPSLAVNENTPADVAFGDPVKATDPDDGDTLTYTLGGRDSDSFDIDSKTGQLKTKAALDYEERTDADENSEPYIVTVTASDGVLSASVGVSIAVTDLTEPPDTPEPPAVAAAASGGHVVLEATWTAPSNAGPPITGYDVQYGVQDSGGWSLIPSGDDDIRGLSANIANLTPDTAYEVQVRARNDEGVSEWSESGTERTSPPPNNPPVFEESAGAMRMVAEDALEAVSVGAPVTAEDADGDTLTYSLSGADSASFAIIESSGQLKTKAPLDYEAKDSYSVTVTVRDGNGGVSSVNVTISINDVDEPPGAPDAPTVEAAATDADTALDVTWMAPPNIGPAITGYDVQYRMAGSGGDFSDASYDGVGFSATVTGLSPNTIYEVQVRARNDEGYGDWSDVGEGRTSSGSRIAIPGSNGAPEGNGAPAFEESPSATRAVDENTAAGQLVGRPVAAVDRDRDTLVYLFDGKDEASFDLDTSTGQIRTVAPLDYETRPAYEVIVEVRDGNGGEDSIAVAIGVRDVNEPPIFEDGERATRRVIENSPADVAVGAPVTAADPDEGDTLSYTLWDTCGERGPSGWLVQEMFDVNSSTGGLTTRAPLDDETRASYFDYEERDSYQAAVHVRDFGGAEACIEVTIEVADAPEPPGAPSTPAIHPALDDGHLGLHIGWDSLPASVRPAVIGYEVQYRRLGNAVFSGPLAVDHISVTITMLEPDTHYEAQVRAVNADGKGPWSHSGVGRTERGPNRAPSFEEGSSTVRDVDENTPPRESIGASVVAVDANPRDRLRYWLSGADADAFAIVASSGRIRTKEPLDYEMKDRYSVRVNVEDGKGGEDSIRVSISVNDVDEPPGAPDAPVVETADDDGQTKLMLTWTLPLNTGPPITDYDVQYRLVGSGGFTDASYQGVGLSAIVAGLSPGSAYEAQVRATNDEGTGEWSAAGEGSTALPLNSSPSFKEGVSAVRAVDENTAAGQPIGAPVAAADPDSGDVLTYSLTGPDVFAFAIEAATAQVVTKEPIDHESKASYSVIVVADDGNGGAASIAVAIGIADVNEPPVAVEDSAITDEDTAIAVPVLENDSDEDAGASLSITSASQPRSGGVIVGAGGGVITYTPNTNFYGEDSFTYAISDGALIATGSVNVIVAPVNDAPVAVGRIPPQRAEVGGDALGLELSEFFSDPDDDALAYAAGPSTAIVAAAIDGSSLTVTPLQAGETTIVVTASDPNGASTQEAFQLIVVGPPPGGDASQIVELVVPDEPSSVTSGEEDQTATSSAHSEAAAPAGENCAMEAPQGALLPCVSVELLDLEANRLDIGLDLPEPTPTPTGVSSPTLTNVPSPTLTNVPSPTLAPPPPTVAPPQTPRADGGGVSAGLAVLIVLTVTAVAGVGMSLGWPKTKAPLDNEEPQNEE